MNESTSKSIATNGVVIGRKSNCVRGRFEVPERDVYCYFGQQENPTFGVGLCRIPPNSSNEEHAHPEADEVLIVLSGEMNIKIEGDDIFLGSGDAILVPQDSKHQIFNSSSFEDLWHSFTFSPSGPEEAIRSGYGDENNFTLSQASLDGRTSDSVRLMEIAKKYFAEVFMPLVAEVAPEALGCFFVLVTSSVAYGCADSVSDVDTFVLFPKQADYERFFPAIEDALRRHGMSEEYRKACDKGIRPELESFQAAGIDGVVKKPDDVNAWLEQKEWIAHWFATGERIVDFDGQCQSFQDRIASPPRWYFPTRLTNNLHEACALIQGLENLINTKTEGHLFVTQRLFFGVAVRLMYAEYWARDHLLPHPKWLTQLLSPVYGVPAKGDPSLRSFDTSILSSPVLMLEIAQYYLARMEVLSASTSDDTLSQVTSIVEKIQWPSTGINLVLTDELGSKPTSSSELWLTRNEWFEKLPDNIDVAYDQVMRTNLGITLSLAMEKTGINILHSRLEIRKRVVEYLHFLLWRKTRVLRTARRRGLPFDVAWWAHQAVGHAVHLACEASEEGFDLVWRGDWPSLVNQSSELIDRLRHFSDSFQVTDVSDIESTLWELRGLLGGMLEQRTLLSGDTWKPIEFQYRTQFWKYEDGEF